MSSPRSLYRMCSLTIECVLLLCSLAGLDRMSSPRSFFYFFYFFSEQRNALAELDRMSSPRSLYRMCSLTIECVLVLCSLAKHIINTYI